jgi:glycosyltransferase involved in cell wall biosynthesis
MPTVSVVIPTHNRAHMIERAIVSVINQTYRDIEIIVVDDASNDNTQAVLEKIRDPRIRVIRHDLNKGGSAARNTGIKAAHGEYIGLLDDDDEWLPAKLEKQVELFDKSTKDLGLVYSGFLVVSLKNSSILIKITPEKKGCLFQELLRENLIGSPTTLIKKVCFIKAGYFDENLKGCQDWDMWVRISRYYRLDFIPEPLSKSYVHGNQISVDLKAKISSREQMIKKYHDDLIKTPSTLAFLLKRLGILHCINCNRFKGLLYFIRSIHLLHRQSDCYKHILFCLLAPSKHRQLLNRQHVLELDGTIFYY